jgi:hypothetical protein
VVAVAVAGSEAAACELAASAVAVASAQAALVAVVSAQPGFEQAVLLAAACVQLALTGGL